MTSLEQRLSTERVELHIELARRALLDTDKRWAKRTTVDQPIFLIDDATGQSIPCVLRNTSETGALLEFPPIPNRLSGPCVTLGARMTIVILGIDHSEVAEIEVVRVDGSQAGVRYRTSFETFRAPNGR